MVLQQPQVLGDDLLGRRAFETDMPELQQQAFLQVARGHADGIEALHELQRLLDLLDRPGPHRRDLVERGDQHAVVVQVADDGRADIAQLVVVGQQRELPQHVIGQRRRRRERVLDGRQLFDFLRRVRPVAVVEIVAEEIFVVAVVPGIALFLGLGFGLLGLRRGFGRLKVLGRHLFEHRVFDDFLVQQIGQLERRHRQQLDGLLQRRRQNELLNELCV